MKMFKIDTKNTVSEIAEGTVVNPNEVLVQQDGGTIIVRIEEKIDEKRVNSVKGKVNALLKAGLTESAKEKARKPKLTASRHATNNGAQLFVIEFPTKGFKVEDKAQADAVKKVQKDLDTWLAQQTTKVTPADNGKKDFATSQPKDPKKDPADDNNGNQPRGETNIPQNSQKRPSAPSKQPWWRGLTDENREEAVRKFLES